VKARIAVIGLKGIPATGGAATVGESLIFELKDRFEFEVLSTSSHAQFPVINGIKQVIFPSFGNSKVNTFYYYIRCVIFVLFQKRYDLIHLHHAESGFITPFLRMKYKVITTYHGMFHGNYIDPKFSTLINKFFRFSQQLNIIFSNSNVSVSKIDSDFMNKKLKKDKIIYIPNGINIPGIKENVYKSGYISFAANRIYQIKGLHILLEALKALEYKKKLMIIGDITHTPEYSKNIKEKYNSLNLHFTGKVHSKIKLFEIISGSDFFVFPSLKEAMPMMLLEVVSLQIPIISSDILEIKQIFGKDELLFFESGSSKSLAEQINYLESNPNSGVFNSKNAFKKVKRNFCWDKIAEEYSEIYNFLLKI